MSAEMWVILTAVLAAVTCGWIGTFLVLRQNAMLGDAISHAVLPGLVIGFLLTSSRAVLPMIIGAAAMGLLTAYLTEVLRRSGRVYGDAALTVVFTLLFAVGVILVSAYAGQIDFDQECVLYGEIAYSPWDRFVVGTTDLGPRAVWILSGALLLNVAFVLLFYKQLKITSFDPQMAQVVGISPRRWHYLLMAMVSLTVVASFELVGAILVVAMLIIPGAVGTLLSQRLPLVLAIAVVTGVIAAVGGYYAAAVFDASIAGFMAVVGGVLFVVAVFGSRALERLRA